MSRLSTLRLPDAPQRDVRTQQPQGQKIRRRLPQPCGRPWFRAGRHCGCPCVPPGRSHRRPLPCLDHPRWVWSGQTCRRQSCRQGFCPHWFYLHWACLHPTGLHRACPRRTCLRPWAPARRTRARRNPRTCPGEAPAAAQRFWRGPVFRHSQQRHFRWVPHRSQFAGAIHSADEPTVRNFRWARNHPGRITTIQAAISV